MMYFNQNIEKQIDADKKLTLINVEALFEDRLEAAFSFESKTIGKVALIKRRQTRAHRRDMRRAVCAF